MIAFLFFSHFWQAVEEIMENVLATFNLQPSFFNKVRQYPCRFLPLHMPKTDAVIMIWSLKVHYMYNKLGTQGCCFFLTPPPLSLLNGSVCIASSSIKTFNATQQLGNGLLPLWHPNDFFVCIAGLRVKKNWYNRR